jgi:hypothetical protein
MIVRHLKHLNSQIFEPFRILEAYAILHVRKAGSFTHVYLYLSISHNYPRLIHSTHSQSLKTYPKLWNCALKVPLYSPWCLSLSSSCAIVPASSFSVSILATCYLNFKKDIKRDSKVRTCERGKEWSIQRYSVGIICRESVQSHISYTYTSTDVTYNSMHSRSKVQKFESPGRCRGGRGREAAAPVTPFKHSNTFPKNSES